MKKKSPSKQQKQGQNKENYTDTAYATHPSILFKALFMVNGEKQAFLGIPCIAG